MNDLTFIYYTANRIDERFAANVRAHLESIAGEIPIVSVSQKPIALGLNICVGEIGAGVYNCYRQILAAAEAAETDYVACCEDDTLYTREHFGYRPPPDIFAYNKSRWWVEPEGVFRWRDRSSMHACIAPRKLLIGTLRTKFDRFPQPITDRKRLRSWGEPGRYEGNLKLPQVALEYFMTSDPVVTFNHADSLMGLRKRRDTDRLQEYLPPWGSARELWEAMHA